MKRVLIIAVAAALAAAAWPSPPQYEYEGKWGSYGYGNGQFDETYGLDVAPGGNVYVADTRNDRIQYFKWVNVAVSPASLGRVKALFR